MEQKHALTVADKNALRSPERRILRNIFDLYGIEVNGDYGITWN